MPGLSARECVPCRGDVPALRGEEIAGLLEQVRGWEVVEEHHISKAFTFPDFAQGLDFVNKVGALAEEQGHHPDIHLSWGKVKLEIWTHKIDGLAESDFVMAAKIDVLAAA